jgi:hypothetical protein
MGLLVLDASTVNVTPSSSQPCPKRPQGLSPHALDNFSYWDGSKTPLLTHSGGSDLMTRVPEGRGGDWGCSGGGLLSRRPA